MAHSTPLNQGHSTSVMTSDHGMELSVMPTAAYRGQPLGADHDGAVDGLSDDGKPLDSHEEFSDKEQTSEEEKRDSTEHFNAHYDEGVIKTGADVSKYVVSLRDDGDTPLTFRGFVIGTLILALQSAVTMIYSAKPVSLSLSSIFVLLLCWAALRLWYMALPRPSLLDGRDGMGWLRKVLTFINPGPIGLKEHVTCVVIASSGLNGSAGSDVLGVMKLFYSDEASITPVMVAFGLFSVSLIGVGLVGLMRSFIVYPSEAVYWYTLPMVAVFQLLHHEKEHEKRRFKMFWSLLGGTLLYEPLIAYVSPWLNGVSIPCLASMNAPIKTRRHIARIFGGASANQGLGLLQISVDPQYVSPSTYAGFPLKWQLSFWAGLGAGAFVLLGLYYGNAWNAQTFPFMSSALFLANGTIYPQNELFAGSGELNVVALEKYGLPRMTASNVWSFFCQCAAVGALVTHVSIFWGKDIFRYLREHTTGTHSDPHYQAMAKKYKEVPHWWYLTILIVAIAAAFVTVGCSHTTLPLWGLVVALLVGICIAPFSAILYSQYGSSVATNMLSKMVAGAVHGGRPLANLWFANYCHQIVNLVVSLGDFLKLGQYLKIPWRTMFIIQVYGTLVGAYLNWFILSSIIDNKREILLDPIGDNQWSGAYYQGLNAAAVEWSLAKYVFSRNSETGYWICPFGVFIGALAPVAHWILKKNIACVERAGDLVMTPLLIYYLAYLVGGINSYVFSSIVVGVYMQVYLRVYKPKIFREYCYLLSGAVDGGAQVAVLILSLAVFGASGKSYPFPTWFGNPDGPPDHCVTTKVY